MKRTIVALILIFISGYAYAGSFNIGGKGVVIPDPQGFSYVNQEMNAVYRLSLKMTDPKNDQLAYYISNSDIPMALNGEIPPLERTFLLKVNKQLKNMVIGLKDFAGLKNMTKRQNKEFFESIKSQVPDLMKDASAGISKEFNVDFAMQISQMIPLDPHYEADNALSYSMYINYGVLTEGAKEESIVSATATYVNVAGKVLFLYCYGPKGDLEWTRSASKEWAEQIMNSNTQPPAKSSGGRGMDWSKVIEKGIIGAVMGGLIALIIGVVSVFRKKKKG
jgi:hypothetical protein